MAHRVNVVSFGLSSLAGKGVQLMLKRKPRVVEWNSCIDVPLSRGVLGNVYFVPLLSESLTLFVQQNNRQIDCVPY